MPQLSPPTTLVTVAQKFFSYGYFTLSRSTLPSRSHAFSGFPSLLGPMPTRPAHPLPEAEGCDSDQGCDSPRASFPPGPAPLCALYCSSLTGWRCGQRDSCAGIRHLGAGSVAAWPRKFRQGAQGLRGRETHRQRPAAARGAPAWALLGCPGSLFACRDGAEPGLCFRTCPRPSPWTSQGILTHTLALTSSPWRLSRALMWRTCASRPGCSKHRGDTWTPR